MIVLKRRQIVVLSLVLVVIVAGYLQYSYNGSGMLVDGKEKIGEAVYVENNANQEATSQNSDEKGADDKAQNSQQTNAVTASKDFFSQARLDREIAEGKSKDALREIAEDTNATNEIKTDAYNQLMKIVDNAQRQTKIEALIKEKGIENVIAYFADDGSLDIVIKAPVLTSAQIAQVADVASRFASVDMDKIHVKNIN